MGTFFIIAVCGLTFLALLGLILEIGFWRNQIRTIRRLSQELEVKDPDSMEDWLDRELPDGDPLRPAINRILATDHAPESSVDLIEPDRMLVRVLSGVRRYALSVALLCGIAGTLFSLQDAIPANGKLVSGKADTVERFEEYERNFRDLQSSLANAFWPSICGVVSTLLLQAIRYAALDPAHHRAGRDFVALASSVLIPWTLRHQKISLASADAASKLEIAAKAFATATREGAVSVHAGAKSAQASFANLGEVVGKGCGELVKAFENSANRIDAAGSAALASVKGAAGEVTKVVVGFGTALGPLVQQMEGAAKTMGTAATRFDNSVASNGPFLKAMEQLYDASSPAEKRYEQLLMAVMKMQEITTTQNACLLRLHGETVALAKSGAQAAEESARLAQSLQTATAGFPATAEAVRNHGGTLTTAAEQWNSTSKDLVTEFRKFSTEVRTEAEGHRRTSEDLLVNLPAVIAGCLASQLSKDLAPLLTGVTLNGHHTSALQDGIRGLQDSIEKLRAGGQRGGVGTPQPSHRPKKKWHQFWKR